MGERVSIDTEAAVEHAQSVAREAVRAGLTDAGKVRQLYQDYSRFLQQNVRGTFTQLLLARGAIDQAGFNLLQERVPPRKLIPPGPGSQKHSSGLVETWAQPSWREGTGPELDSGGSKGPTESGRLRVDSESGLGTSESGRVSLPGGVPTKNPEGSGVGPVPFNPDRTMNYNQVLTPEKKASGPLGLEDSGSYDPLTDPLPPKAVDSTAGDSRGGRPGSGSGLDVVADPKEERESEFFAIESMSDSAPEMQGDPKLGDVLGEYQLIKVVGRGGMGIIYQAKHTTGALHALKALKVGDGPNSEKRRQRFQREVDALRRLEHPNIITVHTCGRRGLWDWYSMDYVEGRELREAIHEGDLTPLDKLTIFEDVCKAVAHAHERGVVHRDMKPANVLINEQSDVFVLDFGLAKLTDEDLGLTRTGAALGTPYYMAPEQVVNPKDVDFRVDVFSLGVILFELMVGQRPFTGKTAGEVSNKIMNEEPARPSTLNEKLRPGLDVICLKAMEKDPERRYQTVDELRRDVGKYRRGGGNGGPSPMGDLTDTITRYLASNKEPVLVGVLLATLFWLPILLLVVIVS